MYRQDELPVHPEVATVRIAKAELPRLLVHIEAPEPLTGVLGKRCSRCPGAQVQLADTSPSRAIDRSLVRDVAKPRLRAGDVQPYPHRSARFARDENAEQLFPRVSVTPRKSSRSSYGEDPLFASISLPRDHLGGRFSDDVDASPLQI